MGVRMFEKHTLVDLYVWHQKKPTGHTSFPATTLINTVWSFGQQCLAFYNEFSSGAADLNVTYSELQFELGGADVCVCGWASGHEACVRQMTNNKVNRHQMPLMKVNE